MEAAISHVVLYFFFFFFDTTQKAMIEYRVTRRSTEYRFMKIYIIYRNKYLQARAAQPTDLCEHVSKEVP